MIPTISYNTIQHFQGAAGVVWFWVVAGRRVDASPAPPAANGVPYTSRDPGVPPAGSDDVALVFLVSALFSVRHRTV